MQNISSKIVWSNHVTYLTLSYLPDAKLILVLASAAALLTAFLYFPRIYFNPLPTYQQLINAGAGVWTSGFTDSEILCFTVKTSESQNCLIDSLKENFLKVYIPKSYL